MVSLDDLRELVIYKKSFFLPINIKDKKKGSAIFLMTPNYNSSLLAMNMPYAINRRYFESYYLNKAISVYINGKDKEELKDNNECVFDSNNPGDYLFEEALSSKERNELDDSMFGLPKQRRYPLNDEAHVLAAIRFFNHVEKEYEEELAKNIIKRIGQLGIASKIKVGDKNRFKPYWEKSALYAKTHEDKETIEEMEYTEDDRFYFNEYVTPATSIINDKMISNNVYLNGYADDVKDVQDAFRSEPYYAYRRDFGKVEFSRLGIDIPKKIVIEIINSDELSEAIDIPSNTMTLYNKKLFYKNFDFSYSDYLKYMMQLYAICKAVYFVNKSPKEALANPLAILLSGIANGKVNDVSNIHDNFSAERVYRFIINKYGLPKALDIVKYNRYKEFWDYSREYNLSIVESDLWDDDVDINAVNEIGELPDVSIPMPKSLDDIAKFATRFKRKIRKQSVYKLNKIRRDIERGNLGTENRSGIDSTVTQLQTGDITGQSVPEKIDGQNADGSTVESYTFGQLKRWSNGDYILEGNYMYLFEDNINYDLQLRKAIYKDRFRTDREVLNYYKKVKLDCQAIKYTYVNLNMYRGKNLFVDLSYYNDSFFRNMMNLNDDGKNNTLRVFKIYIEFMSRMIESFNASGYNKKTVFIPVLDWRHNNSTRMWIYKNDINPISVIYYLMKYDLRSLKKLFGDMDVVFLGGKNYFKINFGKSDFSKMANIQKFSMLINRLLTLGFTGVDPDPADELDNSPSGIAMDIIDKIETSKNVSIDDLSGFNKLNKSINLINNSKLDEDPAATAVKNDIIPDNKTPSNDIKTIRTGEKAKIQSVRTKITQTVYADSKEINQIDALAATKPSISSKSVNNTTEDEKKKAIVDKVVHAANKSDSTDDALDKLNTEEFKNMITELENNSENNMRVDESRASKIIAIDDEFHKKEVAGKSVKDLLNEDPNKFELPVTDLKIASVNKDWSELKFINFDKHYDPNSDIVKMLDSMKYWTFPIGIRNIEVKDNSTSEDIVDLWKIDCIDYKGSRFTLKVDIPRFINGSNFLKLRGNEKNLLIQSTMVPITKSDSDACQIIGSGGYNKTFIYRMGNRRGQSLPATNKLLRTLNNYMKNTPTGGIKVTPGDNSKICEKYELPIDYIDLASTIDSIKYNNYTFYFNQDELRLKYQIDDTKGIPVGIDIEKNKDGKAVETVLYYTTSMAEIYGSIAAYIGFILREDSKFRDIYDSLIVSGTRYAYSQASILSIKLPLIVMCAYLEGLLPVLKKANVEYQFVEKLDSELRRNYAYDYIRFADGYLTYRVTYSSSLLMNGLKECDTESYSIKNVNNREMYLDFLEKYGGRIKGSGLENAYDCMIDPITKEILAMYKLPTDYIEVMLHANNLLSDNKYVRHTYQGGRRWRRKELIAGYFYKALTTAYQEYANSLRNSRKATKMSIKQSAVIDYILSKDPATTNLSVNNVINDVECANTVTNKGLVGMNSARAYSIGTRTYDESMMNVLGMDTAFSGSVGINRQATIDPGIESGRGIVKSIDGDADKLSTAKSLTITEAMTPFGSTHDDPQRTLMTFLQTSKHMIRCENNDPALVTTGADEALPYLCSDIFAFKAKDDGTVVELVADDYMVIQYKDGSNHYINLKEEIKQNSDGGYFVPMKLSTDLKIGSKFKEGNVIAYDKLSFSKSLGESGNLASNLGILAKVAIINTDEAFEDSAIVTESFANKLGSDVIMNIDTVIHKGSNIFIYKNIGDHVMEGDSLFAYQPDFDDEVANALMKNLSIDDKVLSELGRNPIKSRYTGIVAGIEVYRTVELDELSPSLRAFCESYERRINKTKSIYKKYGLDPATLPPTTKMQNIGKAKNVHDGVKIIYYIKHLDTVSAGDKIVFYSANKGIIKSIIDKSNEPYTEFRPDEHIDSFMSLSSISGRMTCSIPIFAAVSKLMVELDRSVKDIAGIKYDPSKL